MGWLLVHSGWENFDSGEITGRWAISDSHKMKINISRATTEIVDPKDEIMFHAVNESG